MLTNLQPKIEPALSNFIRKLVQLLSVYIALFRINKILI